MERTESLPTAAHGSRSQFEREKERLIVDINQGMDTVNRNLIQLNQNLESAISLGTNFDRVSRLWSEFGTIINPPTEDDGGDGACVGEQKDHDDDDHAGTQPVGEADTFSPPEGGDDTFLMDEDE
ncbi:Dolichyl-diphosphooligosaccharide-protein glycosyltransferase subunit dad1 [Coemansia spiralis]|nr:Dolichyl-diphosphooligosaccharide-protein glycosyltransferase subunit dad1 [Coemansia spiralis]